MIRRVFNWLFVHGWLVITIVTAGLFVLAARRRRSQQHHEHAVARRLRHAGDEIKDAYVRDAERIAHAAQADAHALAAASARLRVESEAKALSDAGFVSAAEVVRGWNVQ